MENEYTFDEYQADCNTTAIYPRDRGIEYTLFGLVNEAGEVAGVYKKVIRDNGGLLDGAQLAKLEKEIGDVLWYAAQLCTELGILMSDVAGNNIYKLQDRKDRGVLGGSGDNR